ncbi:putative phenylalanine-tRNA ligase [Babesia sp. Xinjiang]|uniref:putative phenylalanine-tRNA ligase n=1 Tax=Babesia sp. Xinjiang TaxID=462227 RepID=UPI000A244A24|nr:putative phenylalanine-tRNA ligase [Babesia sp. Xinjiang]XP_028871482.1 putative phenylalanine-tRNA ligase [Babesia sp. Xinjiang]ORM40875.1 putative phenylalanine-tRNA ligase [Babesia sp. Xinjiang]ORM41026.1 putative phenylalanine-tRNA ligase [Babesia sp. Xinjiang]
MAYHVGAFRCPSSYQLMKYLLKSNQRAQAHTYTGIPTHVKSKLGRRLDIDPANPVGQTAEIIKDFFKNNYNEHLNTGPPFSYISFDSQPVTIRDNFDELQVPLNHVSREPCDNFYVSDEYVGNFARQKADLHPKIIADVKEGRYTNGVINRMANELGHSKHRVLPTHSTSHLPEILRNGLRRAIYSGQVFRRDAIDSEHYPVFHQMDGIMLFTRGELEEFGETYSDLSGNPTDEDLIIHHLKVTLEKLLAHLFSRVVDTDGDSHISVATTNDSSSKAKSGSANNSSKASSDYKELVKQPLKEWLQWDSDTSFPFTDPSFEINVKLNGEWVEILGCGKLKDVIIDNIIRSSGSMESSSGEDTDIVGGWAFGIGLERLAMVLCRITDIRQFWEEDERFLRQYRWSIGSGKLPVFKPYSRNPPISRDISFYIDGSAMDKRKFDESEFRYIFDELSRDYVEDVAEISQYIHPETGRKSVCYRITYRAMGENLTNAFVNKIHQLALDRIVNTFNIELR